MKRKRFVKLCMGVLGLTRNEANAVADIVRDRSHGFATIKIFAKKEKRNGT